MVYLGFRRWGRGGGVLEGAILLEGGIPSNRALMAHFGGYHVVEYSYSHN